MQVFVGFNGKVGLDLLAACLQKVASPTPSDQARSLIIYVLVILQMRLYALYLMNKKVIAFTLVCFVASSACAATIMGIVLSRMTGDNDASLFLQLELTSPGSDI